MPVPVLSAPQAAAWDAAARDQHGIPSRVLMDAAGRAAAHLLPAAASGGTILVAAGPGNNGGDGWVAARALQAAGWRVYATDLAIPRSPDCEVNRALALGQGVSWLAPDAPWPNVHLLVDALLGTGATGAPRDALGALARRLAESGAPIAAIDGPTGLDLTTGTAHGPVRAGLTVTFGGARRGHLLARDWCGDLAIADIGFPPGDPAWPRLMTDRDAAALLPPLASGMHKGERGKVLVIGGDQGMAGAALHAARAALAAGAGLVKLALPAASVPAAQATLPDAVTVATALGPGLDQALADAVAWADAIALGPGLGRGAARNAFALAVAQAARAPLVLDADALHVPGIAGAGRAPRVLTPHAGEFAAQFPAVALEDRFAAPGRAVRACAAPAAVLLKGVPTVVAGHAGAPWVVARGNVGLATGGSGDVLTGLIAALLARGMAPPEAAAVGAHAAGRAADVAAARTGARALRPADVVTALPEVWQTLAAPARVPPPLLELLPRPCTT